MCDNHKDNAGTIQPSLPSALRVDRRVRPGRRQELLLRVRSMMRNVVYVERSENASDFVLHKQKIEEFKGGTTYLHPIIKCVFVLITAKERFIQISSSMERSSRIHHCRWMPGLSTMRIFRSPREKSYLCCRSSNHTLVTLTCNPTVITTVLDVLFTFEEVKNVLRKLKRGKSPG